MSFGLPPVPSQSKRPASGTRGRNLGLAGLGFVAAAGLASVEGCSPTDAQDAMHRDMTTRSSRDTAVNPAEQSLARRIIEQWSDTGNIESIIDALNEVNVTVAAEILHESQVEGTAPENHRLRLRRIRDGLITMNARLHGEEGFPFENPTAVANPTTVALELISTSVDRIQASPELQDILRRGIDLALRNGRISQHQAALLRRNLL